METKRLIIRQPKEEDALRLCEIANSEFVLRYNAMDVTTEERMKNSIANSKNVFYVLELKENHVVIGAIFLNEDELRYGVDSKMLSYYLDEEYTHKGYMSEALREVFEYCKDGLKLRSISARVFSDNVDSYKMLERLGFILEGELRQAVRGYKDIIYDDRLYNKVL